MVQFSIKHARALVVAALVAAIPALVVPSQALADAAQSMCPPSADARLTSTLTADYPEIVRDKGITGTALVRVYLMTNGDLAGAEIDMSTGNRYLDEAALHAVRESSFAPAVSECNNVAGSYLVEVDFK